MKKKYKLVLGALLSLCLAQAFLYAQAPQLLNYQGKLVLDGKPAQGSYGITFKIYDAETGGTELWSEPQIATVTNGIFNVLLGSFRSFPNDLFTGTGNRFLTLKVEGRPELTQRFRITSVAFAIKSTHADTAQVALFGGALFVDKNGNVGVGTTSPKAALHVWKNPYGGNFPIAIEPGGFGVIGFNSYWNGFSRVYSVDGFSGSLFLSSDGGEFQFQTAARGTAGKPADEIVRMTIRNDGRVGIGTTTPTEKLVVNGNIQATGSITQGSSREYKENIAELSVQEAIATLKDLNPIKFNYKIDEKKDFHLGFIAEEVPEPVATPNRKGIDPMDIVAVLTKVVQEQQKAIAALQEELEILKKQIHEQ